MDTNPALNGTWCVVNAILGPLLHVILWIRTWCQDHGIPCHPFGPSTDYVQWHICETYICEDNLEEMWTLGDGWGKCVIITHTCVCFFLFLWNSYDIFVIILWTVCKFAVSHVWQQDQDNHIYFTHLILNLHKYVANMYFIKYIIEFPKLAGKYRVWRLLGTSQPDVTNNNCVFSASSWRIWNNAVAPLNEQPDVFCNLSI